MREKAARRISLSGCYRLEVTTFSLQKILQRNDLRCKNRCNGEIYFASFAVSAAA